MALLILLWYCLLFDKKFHQETWLLIASWICKCLTLSTIVYIMSTNWLSIILVILRHQIGVTHGRLGCSKYFYSSRLCCRENKMWPKSHLSSRGVEKHPISSTSFIFSIDVLTRYQLSVTIKSYLIAAYWGSVNLIINNIVEWEWQAFTVLIGDGCALIMPMWELQYST